MNLSQETTKELILTLLGVSDQKSSKTTMDGKFIGKKVMVRTYSAGVHFGELVEKCGKQVILKDSRRVFYWTQACSLSQLAMEGSKEIKSCKIAMEVSEILLDEVIEVIPMSEKAIDNLYGADVWKK